MVRTVEDAAITMNVIAGHDPRDVASANLPVPNYTAALTGEVSGLRIGVPSQHFQVPLDPEVRQAVNAALEQLKPSAPMCKRSTSLSLTMLPPSPPPC